MVFGYSLPVLSWSKYPQDQLGCAESAGDHPVYLKGYNLLDRRMWCCVGT